MKALLIAVLALAVLGAAPAYSGLPDVTLASSFISSGGGSGSFSSVRAFDRMIGGDAVLAQEQALRTVYGTGASDRFVRAFDYAISDAWSVASRMNVKLPSAPASGGDSALAKSLLQAGITPAGAFDTNYLFAHLFTPDVQTQVMHDLDTRFGNGTAVSFAQMGNQFFSGVASSLGVSLVQPQ